MRSLPSPPSPLHGTHRLEECVVALAPERAPPHSEDPSARRWSSPTLDPHECPPTPEDPTPRLRKLRGLVNAPSE